MARKNWFFVGVLLMCMMGLFTVVPSSHATLVEENDYIKLSNEFGYGGGAFGVDVAISQGNYDGVTDYYTFCLERNEYFTSGEEYIVYDISDAAIEGGISGGNPDPLEFSTAYLYWNYFNGGLSGWGNTLQNNKDLQNAIWYLEGEYYQTKSQAYNALSAGAKAFVDAAEGAGWTDYNNVAVANIGIIKSDGTYEPKQSNLVMVPEPGTMLMVGSSLFLLAGFGTRRFRKKK